MAALLVVLMVIAVLAVEFLIQRRKRLALVARENVAALRINRITNLIPRGVFLQPSLTWSKILTSGNLMVGLNPVLLGLVGKPDKIDLVANGQNVRKGDTLFTIHKDAKMLRVKSPVNGVVTGLNAQASVDNSWENLSQNWLYTINPENISDEVSGWLVAEKASAWLQEKHQQLKNFFAQLMPQAEMGLTMADGGDLPVGILSHFDAADWQKFEENFIA